MPSRGTPYVIPFGAAGMVAHENRWLSKAGELAIAANVTFENDLAQKENASAHYDQTGIVVEIPQGTLSTASEWQGAAIWLPMAVSPTRTVLVTSIVSTSGAGPDVFTLTGSAAAGALVVVVIGVAAAHDGVNPVATTVTDTHNNTYTRQMSGNAAGPGAGCEIWTSIITTALAVSDAIAVYFYDQGATAKGCAALSYGTQSTGTTEVTSWTATGVASIAVALAARAGRTYPAIIIAGLNFDKTSAASMTWAGGFTARATAQSIPYATQLSVADKFLGVTGIAAQYDWQSNVTGALTGTVTTAANSATVTGSGTAFTTELYAGDQIVVAGEAQIVAAVASNTSLTTVEQWVGTNAGAAAVYIIGSRVITASLAGYLHKETPDSGASGNTGNLDAVTLKSGLTKSRRAGRFVAGGKEIAANNRKLFYFNGVDEVQVLSGNGATTSDIATPPADWDTTANPVKQPLNAVVHKDRLFAFGNLNDAHRLYYSTASDQEDFTGSGSGSLRVASQIGERLYCGATFRGVLFLWKYPKGIFYLDDTSLDYTEWSYRIHSEAVGCAASPHAVLALDDDVLFMDPHGHIHQLTAVDTLGGVRDSDLTRQLGLHGWVRDTIDTTALEQVTSCWNPDLKTAFFGCRSLTNTAYDNDLLLRLDYGLVARGGPIRFSYSTLYRPNALCLKRRDHTGVPALMIGETSTSFFTIPGTYGYRSIYGVTTGFSHTLRTPSHDLADGEPAARMRRKQFRALEFIQASTGWAGQTVTVTVRVDNVTRETLSVTFSDRRRIYQLSVGDGYEIDVQITSATTSTADIGLLGVIVYVEPGGTDNSRVS